MTEDEKREVAIKVAFAYLGTPYQWGGDDPQGFDCSGLMVECLQSVGAIPRGVDLTAQGMWNRFHNYFDEQQARRGDLVFWQNSNGHIIHVEMLISDELSIGAAGGGSTTKTLAEAWRRNAYIKIRPFRSRNGVAGFADPYR